MSTDPGKHSHRWYSSKNRPNSSTRSDEAADHTMWRLDQLHTDILSSAEEMKRVQTEVLQLKQENQILRKQMSQISGGEKPGLRLSADSVSPFVGNNSDGLALSMTAPALLGQPEPKVALQSSHEEETVAPFLNDSALNGAHGAPGVREKTSMMSAPGGRQWSSSRSQQTQRSVRRASTQFDLQKEQAIRGGMIFDAAMVKEQLKKNIVKKEFDVASFYHTDGCAQWIARSKHFEFISMGVIFANSLWIAVDTEHNRADILLDADIGFQVAEHIFCTFFFFEILLRFAAFKRKRDCFRSGWFIFDGSLAVTMVTEDWIMTIVLLASGGDTGGSGNGVSAIKNAAVLRVLRLLRLARVGRFLRLLRQSPEIMIMVKAIWGSMRCVVWTCVVLAALMFVFGMCFTQLCKETPLEEVYFSSLTDSLHTLFIAGLFPDLEIISKSINRENIFFWLLLVLYLVLTSICVLNLLVGVLVEVVKTSSTVERDAMDVAYVKQVFVDTLELSDGEDITMVHISKEAFGGMLQDSNILEALTKVGIDVLGLVDLMDFIFIKGVVSVADFLEVILHLRSSADVTVKDVVEVRKFLTYEIKNVELELKQIRLGIANQAKAVQTVEELLEMRLSALHSPEPRLSV